MPSTHNSGNAYLLPSTFCLLGEATSTIVTDLTAHHDHQWHLPLIVKVTPHLSLSCSAIYCVFEFNVIQTFLTEWSDKVHNPRLPTKGIWRIWFRLQVHLQARRGVSRCMFHRLSHKLLVYNTYFQVAVKAIYTKNDIKEDVWIYFCPLIRSLSTSLN